MKFVDLFQQIVASRVWRVKRHVEYLQNNVKIPKGHDKENFERILENFYTTASKHRIYGFIHGAIFLLLYASVIQTIVQATALNPIIHAASTLTSLLGVTFLTIIFFISQRYMNAVFTDLLIEHSHLVAITVKHNKDFVVHPHYKWGLFKDYE